MPSGDPKSEVEDGKFGSVVGWEKEEGNELDSFALARNIVSPVRYA